jgi:copper chaperone CopZ
MLRLKVSGMTCEHCVAAVGKAVRSVPGAADVAVDLARGEVTVTGSPDERAIRDAIAQEGYAVAAG